MTGLKSRWFVEIFLDGSTVRFWNDFEAIGYDGEVFLPLGDRFTPPDKLKRTATLKSESVKLKFDASRALDDGADILADLLDSTWRNRQIRIRNVFYTATPDAGDVISDTYGRIRNLPGSLAVDAEPIIEMEIESGSLAYLERRMQTRTAENQKLVFPSDRGFDLAKRLEDVPLLWRTKHTSKGSAQPKAPTTNDPAARELPIGEFVTEGSFVAHFTNQQQKKYWHRVYAIADCRIQELSKVWINGNLEISDPLVHGVKTAVPGLDSGGVRCWITFYDGRADQVADAELVSVEPSWTANHRLQGVAYVHIVHLWDSDLPEAFDYKFGGKGARFYDRRLDSSAGGSGSQSLTDPSTWTYTTNPMVIADHYRQGIRIMSGSSAMWFGVGENADIIPYAEFKDLADLCDENVALKSGDTQKRYEAHGILSAADDHKTNLEKLASAMAARAIDTGGRIVFRPVRTQTPVLTLTDGDLIAKEKSDYDPAARIGDMANQIEGRFHDRNQDYKTVDYPRVSDAALIAADGETITATKNFELEIDGERAQRLATLELAYLRRIAELNEVFLSSTVRTLKPGDWITRESALRGFAAGKLFEVSEKTNKTDGTTEILFVEVDPTQQVWNEANAADIPQPPAIDYVISVDLPIPDVTVIPFELGSEESGAILPAVRFEIQNFDELEFEQIEVKLSRGLAADVYFTIPGNVETFETSGGLLPSALYTVYFRSIFGAKRSLWSDAQTFTTTENFSAKASDATPGSPLEDALGILDEAKDHVSELILSLMVRLDETRENLGKLAKIDGVNVGTILENVRRQIVENGEALSQAIDVVSARVDDAESAIVTEALARANAILAEAQARALVTARLANAETAIVQNKTARIEADLALGEDIQLIDTRLTGVESGQTGQANALAALTTRVRSNEIGLTSQSDSLTSLTNRILLAEGNLTGQSTSVANLTSRVWTAENTISTLSNNFTQLSGQVNSVSSQYSGIADALSIIQSAIEDAGGTINIDLSDITSLNARLADAEGNISGQSAALTALTSRVSNAEGLIETSNTQYTSLVSQIEDLTATVDIVAGTSGSTSGTLSSYLGLRGVAGTSEYEFAAFAGTGAPSVITIRADQIRMNGSVIIAGSLQTSGLASNAVTERKNYSGVNTAVPSNGSKVTIMTGLVPSAGGDVDLEIDLDVIATGSSPFGFFVEYYVGGVLKRNTKHLLSGNFTHTIQSRARFQCSNNASLVVKAYALSGASSGVSGVSISNCYGRSVEQKR